MNHRLRRVLFHIATTTFVVIAAMLWARTASQATGIVPLRLPAVPVDPLTASHERVAALLPATGRVSYLTDRDFEVDRGSLARFYRAQWVLAPRVLERDDGNAWALADYEDTTALERLISGGQWVIVERVGEGMLVLRRAEVQP
jgi:hypothetical protein